MNDSLIATTAGRKEQVLLAILSGVLIIGCYLLWNYWSRAPLALIAAVAAAGLVLVYVYPVTAAMAVAFIAVGRISGIPEGITSPILFVTVVVLLVKKLTSGQLTWTVTPFMRWGIVFIGWRYFSSIWASSFQYFEWSTAYRLLLIMFAFAETVKTRRDLWLVLAAGGLGVVASTLFALRSLQAFFQSGVASLVSESSNVALTTRYSGGWSDPNFMAVTIVIFVGFGYAMMRSRIPWPYRISGLATVLFGILGVVLSLSRGGLIALAIVLVGGILAERRRFALLILFLFVIVTVSLVFPIDVIGRLGTLAIPSVDASVSQRASLYSGGFHLALDSLPFGVGAGNFRTYIADYVPSLPFGMISHNGYLQILVESGVIGLGLFVFVLVSLFRTTSRAAHHPSKDGSSRKFPTAMRATLYAMVWTHLVLNTEYYGPYWIAMTLISVYPLVVAECGSLTTETGRPV